MAGHGARVGSDRAAVPRPPSGVGGRRVATGHLVFSVLTLMVILLLYYTLLQRTRPMEDAP